VENFPLNPLKKLKKRKKKSALDNPKPLSQPLPKEKKDSKILPNGQQAFKVI
jgi:hypothetical protein